MRSYSMAATQDIDDIVAYIRSICRLESGLKYVARVREKIEALSYSADALPFSRRRTIKNIHPMAKSLAIMNHKWTVVFHMSGEYVIVDRLLPSKMITN